MSTSSIYTGIDNILQLGLISDWYFIGIELISCKSEYLYQPDILSPSVSIPDRYISFPISDIKLISYWLMCLISCRCNFDVTTYVRSLSYRFVCMYQIDVIQTYVRISDRYHTDFMPRHQVDIMPILCADIGSTSLWVLCNCKVDIISSSVLYSAAFTRDSPHRSDIGAVPVITIFLYLRNSVIL